MIQGSGWVHTTQSRKQRTCIAAARVVASTTFRSCIVISEDGILVGRRSWLWPNAFEVDRNRLCKDASLPRSVRALTFSAARFDHPIEVLHIIILQDI